MDKNMTFIDGKRPSSKDRNELRIECGALKNQLSSLEFELRAHDEYETRRDAAYKDWLAVRKIEVIMDKKKPTIAEIEQMLNEPDRPIDVMPNGEIRVHVDKNKELHEKFFPDECWHEWDHNIKKCSKCPLEYTIIHPAFHHAPTDKDNPQYDSDPVAYRRLMDKVMQHEKYTDFLEHVRKKWVADDLSKGWPFSNWLLRLFHDMSRGTYAIHEFFCSN